MTTANRIIKYLIEHPGSDSVDLAVGLTGCSVEHIMQALADLTDAGIVARKHNGLRSWYKVLAGVEFLSDATVPTGQRRF